MISDIATSSAMHIIYSK
jgi:hypothetical protein